MGSQLITTNRRSFLRGIGATIALPIMESLIPSSAMAAAATNKARGIQRMVCVGSAYGFQPSGFFPTQTGSQFVLPAALKPLAAYQSKLAIFEGLDHNVGGGHRGVKAFLTGVKEHSDFAPRYSLDEYMADHLKPDTRFSSLALGIGKGGGLSWTKYGVKRGVISSPSLLYNKLFKPINPESYSTREEQYRTEHSILNAVMDSARRTRKKLGTEDRDKFEEYLNSIDETESRLRRHELWMKRKKPDVGDESSVLSMSGYGDMDQRIVEASMMFDLMALALKTDSTRIMTLAIPGGNVRYNLPGVMDGYHALTHHGKGGVKIEQLHIIEAAYTAELAKFLEKLDNTEIDGRPLLDSTMVLTGSGMGNASSHSNKNLPVMIAGGGVKPGSYKLAKDGKRQPLSNLYLSMLQKHGLEAERFAKSSGNFNQYFG